MSYSKTSSIREGLSRLKFKSGVQRITVYNDNRVVITFCLYSFVALCNREGDVRILYLSMCEGPEESL